MKNLTIILLTFITYHTLIVALASFVTWNALWLVSFNEWTSDSRVMYLIGLAIYSLAIYERIEK